jgi:hypothetical protein
VSIGSLLVSFWTHARKEGPARPVAFWGNAGAAGAVFAALSGWGLIFGALAALASGVAFFYRGASVGEAFRLMGLLAVSLLLSFLVMLFLGVVTLLAVCIVTFIIMAGSGFDFDAAGESQQAWDAALLAYQSTAGWQLAMAVFLFGLAVLVVGLARSAPQVAASVQEGRVVALEVYNWTRKQGVRLFAAALAVFVIPVGLAALIHYLVPERYEALLLIVPIALGIYAWCSLSAASYELMGVQKLKFEPVV